MSEDKYLTLENEAQVWFSRKAIDSFDEWLLHLRNNTSTQFPSGWIPREIIDAQNAASNLKSHIQSTSKDGHLLPYKLLDPCTFPFLRYAIERYIQVLINQKEDTAKLSHRQEPQDLLNVQIECGRSVLKIPLLADVSPVEQLHLSHYFNLETLARIMGQAGQLVSREYDEKFHILMEPSLFVKDLRYFIDQCTMRNRPVTAAFIDIDKFKEFNTKLGESTVDRDVLPYFMKGLEAFLFGKGYAYRQGGDEYLVILPNSGHEEALQFFESLRKYFAVVTYPKEMNIDRPTVSIGVCTASPSDRKSPLEIQQLANRAEKHAKDNGRNRVAGYKAEVPQADTTLFIFTTENEHE
jgi:diguanylate cyclase (GGDEF)-like protein